MKKALAILLVYSILMTLLVVSPFTASADEKNIDETSDTVASGTTGDCTWELEDGVLTISGNGNMADYINDVLTAPWHYYDYNTVVIKNGVTSIGEDAFYYCTSLKSVTIPDSVTSIGNFAFSGCARLTSVDIPDSVTSIGASAFSGCSSLKSVTIPDSVTSIDEYAFSSCKSLKSVTIPDSVTSIGEYAFSSCKSLTSVTLSQFAVDRFRRIFCDESERTENITIENVVLTDSVTSIGSSAFNDCTSLTSVTIGNSVTSIGDSAFYKCTGLTSVTIGNSVTSIGGSAFYGCTGLTSVTIPDSVTSIGGSAFSGCKGLTSIDITDSVEAIGGSSFYGCPLMTSVTIPSTVTEIYDKAFGYYYKEGFGTTKIKDFTIYGYKNSEAERYANDNHFKFIALDDEPSDPTKTTDREIFGDIDGDGIITVVDSTFLQRYAIQAETPYPIGEKMK